MVLLRDIILSTGTSLPTPAELLFVTLLLCLQTLLLKSSPDELSVQQSRALHGVTLH